MDLLAAYASDDTSSSADEAEIDTVDNQPVKHPRLEAGCVSQRAADLHLQQLCSSPSVCLCCRTGKEQGTAVCAAFKLPSAEAALAGLIDTSSTLQQRLPVPAAAAVTPQPLLIPLGNGKHLRLPPEPPRIRIFPHVDGNYPTAVYVTGGLSRLYPVYMLSLACSEPRAKRLSGVLCFFT
jgi:hypothetical protein